MVKTDVETDRRESLIDNDDAISIRSVRQVCPYVPPILPTDRHCNGKGKVDHALPEHRWGAHLPLIAFEPVGG